MSETRLPELLAELDRELAADERGPGVARVLGRYASSADDWRKYAHFGATYYARNLVHRTTLYELIVLCWKPGQKSPIHDHQGQRCWMGVLQGDVIETLYRAPIRDGERMERRESRRFARGSVAFIVDSAGWHRIEPAPGGPAITLHLYSRPISECRTYDEETGEYGTRSMSYHSVGGIPVSLGT